MEEVVTTLQSWSTWINVALAIPAGWFAYYSQRWIDVHLKNRREIRRSYQEAENEEFRCDLKMLDGNPGLAAFFIAAESRLRWSSLGWAMFGLFMAISTVLQLLNPADFRFGFVGAILSAHTSAAVFARAYRLFIRAQEKGAIIEIVHDGLRHNFKLREIAISTGQAEAEEE